MFKQKRTLSFSLIIALLLTMTLSMFSGFAAQTANELVIVHTNDVHSRVENEAYVAAYVNKLKGEKKDVLLFSAGDVLHGQPIATISGGKTIVDIMNAASYDAMVPGNHDFNYGFEHLLELEKSMKFDLVCANAVYKSNSKPVFKEYVIKDVAGAKVGIFGLSTPETATKTNPKNVEGLEFLPPVETAEKMVKKLKEEKADIIIALVHLGVDKETAEDEKSTALGAVEGIDLIVDGHSHTQMDNGTETDNALIVQTGEYLNNFGVVDLTINDNKVTDAKASLFALDDAGKKTLTPDKSVLDTIAKAQKENEKITSEVIAKVPFKLEGEREDVRMRETNLSNLITDAMLKATDADIAITNGGGIRASIEAGDITKGDILTVLPFGNFICTIEISGQAVIDALEHGLNTYPELAGHFSQVAGINVAFDPNQPAGSRIISVNLSNGEPIDKNAKYKVATNDFMAIGGDEYTMFANNSAYMEYGALDEAVIDYITSVKDLSYLATEPNRIAVAAKEDNTQDNQTNEQTENIEIEGSEVQEGTVEQAA